MSQPPPPTAVMVVRLARSLVRMVFVPAAVMLAGLASMVAGVVTAEPAVAAIGLVALGALITLAGGATMIVLLSIRLTVEPAQVVVSWFGGQRRYTLAPGPVTRVRLRGPGASRLRPRSGAMGWGIGSARLRDEEDIDLVRLAPTATAILVPTESGRLAIAPANDQALLDALAAAAAARRQIEVEASVHAEPELAEPEVDFEPTALTGIERARLEDRLLRERLEAVRAAEAARATAALAVEEDVAQVAAATAARRPRLAGPPRVVGMIYVVLPTAAASAAWWLGTTFGNLPLPGSDVARLTALGLVMAGPATSIGAVMALAWWPRLVGVVVAGGLVAIVLVGRALIG